MFTNLHQQVNIDESTLLSSYLQIYIYGLISTNLHQWVNVDESTTTNQYQPTNINESTLASLFKKSNQLHQCWWYYIDRLLSMNLHFQVDIYKSTPMGQCVCTYCIKSILTNLTLWVNIKKIWRSISISTNPHWQISIDRSISMNQPC